MKPTFYSDPGHGWLAVSRQELIDLGVMHMISGYSYQRKDTVYLEEDCDVAIYIDATIAKGGNYEPKVAKPAQRSRIRNYQNFCPTAEEMKGKKRLPSGWQFE